MADRKYTLAEIDEMREAVRFSMLRREYDTEGNVTRIIGDTYSTPIGGAPTTVIPAVDPTWVEARLRTYLAAGLGPEDLPVDKVR